MAVGKGMNRKQLDTGHTQLANMVKHLAIHQARKGAAQMLRHCRMAHTDAAQVGFINHSAVPGHRPRMMITPGKCWINHPRLGYEWRAVPSIKAEVEVR